MRIESGLQADHSDYMRLVASFADEESAKRTHEQLVKHMEELFARADNFTCVGFGQTFESEDAFQKWKAEKWDPVANQHSTLEVTKKEDGAVQVLADYGLILDDWCRDEVGVALEGSTVAIRTYTAGYGLDYLDHWLSERGGKVDVQVEGSEYDFVPFETALTDVQAPTQPPGTGGVRAEDSDDRPAGAGGDGELPGQEHPVHGTG